MQNYKQGHNEKQIGLKQQTENFWNLILYEIAETEAENSKMELGKLMNKKSINRGSEGLGRDAPSNVPNTI